MKYLCDFILFIEIIDNVRQSRSPPFRPALPADTGRWNYQDLMTSCWDEECFERPRFDEIMKNLKKMNGGK